MSVVVVPPPELQLAPPEHVPDLSKFQVEDGQPVDSIYHGFQQQFLVDTLYSSWSGPGEGRPFLVVRECGLFYSSKKPPICPDVMLAVDVNLDALEDPLARRSYFVWEIGKPPDVVIEMASPTPGGEDTTKLEMYARVGVPFYAIFDPHHYLSAEELRFYAKQGSQFRRADPTFIESVGLGLAVWHGEFVRNRARWLRWIDSNGQPIPSGAERATSEKERAEIERRLADAERQRAENERIRAEAARQRAEKEQQRAEEERQRAEEERQRAEEERQRAEKEQQRADAEKQRADSVTAMLHGVEERAARLAAKLKDAGMSANGD